MNTARTQAPDKRRALAPPPIVKGALTLRPSRVLLPGCTPTPTFPSLPVRPRAEDRPFVQVRMKRAGVSNGIDRRLHFRGTPLGMPWIEEGARVVGAAEDELRRSVERRHHLHQQKAVLAVTPYIAEEKTLFIGLAEQTSTVQVGRRRRLRQFEDGGDNIDNTPRRPHTPYGQPCPPHHQRNVDLILGEPVLVLTASANKIGMQLLWMTVGCYPFGTAWNLARNKNTERIT